MLVNFCLENFKSFKGMEEFTMIASENPKGSLSERLCYDEDRLIHAGDPEYRLLPVSAIFGANSYGKSTFVESLLLVQKLVLDPAGKGEEIPVSPFFIDPDSKTLPTSFDLNLLSEGDEYEIYVKLDKNGIIEERVSMVKGESVKDMYHRKDGLAVAESLDREGKIRSALESSSDKALLLSNPMVHDLKEFRPIYNWFSETLLVVSSGAKFIYSNDPDALSSQLGKAISYLDTGVEAVKMDQATLGSISLPPEEAEELWRNLKTKKAAYFITAENDMFIARAEGEKIFAKMINIVKKDSNGNEFCARLREESSGTRRLLHLLLAILQLGKADQNKVVIIDDFDKNLHEGMTWGLVEYHLNNLDERGDSQLIFTTHDAELIDNCILRDDEVWITRKSQEGVSEMICLVEFEENKTGLSFQQLYRADSLGGTPRIALISFKQVASGASGLRV